MADKFNVSVALAIFAKTSDDSSIPTKCAFYDKGGKLYLPNIPLSTTRCAHELVLDLVKVLVPVDLRMLTITPVSFFDPIIEDETQRAEREILLGYRLIVSPGMPISSELEFKDHAEVRIATERISQNHLRLFRLGLSYGN